jgi:hypothetical protein
MCSRLKWDGQFKHQGQYLCFLVVTGKQKLHQVAVRLFFQTENVVIFHAKANLKKHVAFRHKEREEITRKNQFIIPEFLNFGKTK